MVTDLPNIELTPDDLYANGYYVQFADGTQIIQRDILSFPKTGSSYIELVEGQTLDQLAYSEYLNSKLWFNIADNNNILNPFNIPSGAGLFIPKI